LKIILFSRLFATFHRVFFISSDVWSALGWCFNRNREARERQHISNIFVCHSFSFFWFLLSSFRVASFYWRNRYREIICHRLKAFRRFTIPPKLDKIWCDSCYPSGDSTPKTVYRGIDYRQDKTSNCKWHQSVLTMSSDKRQCQSKWILSWEIKNVLIKTFMWHFKLSM
jgi:hypothetical protein